MDKIYDYDANTDDVSTLMNFVKYVRSMDQMLECGFSYDKDNKGKCSAQSMKTKNSLLLENFCILRRMVYIYIF